MTDRESRARAHPRSLIVASVIAVVVTTFGGGSAVALWSVSSASMTSTVRTGTLTALAAPALNTRTTTSLTVGVERGPSSETMDPEYVIERSASADFSTPLEVWRGSQTSFTDQGHIPATATSARFSKIAVAASASCGIAAGRVLCWGLNSSYQLGRGEAGPSPNVPLPVMTSADSSRSQLPATETLVDIDAGLTTFCASSATAVFCWGGNVGGAANPASSAMQAYPVRTAHREGSVVSSVSLGRDHACAVFTPGGAWCWGSNEFGQLGAGGASTTTPSAPVQVMAGGASKLPTAATVTAISAGTGFTCLIASGKIYCFGANNAGNLGNGTRTDSAVPVAVEMGRSSAIPPTGIATSSALSAQPSVVASSRAACAIVTFVAYCWGANGNGALGAGLNVAVTTAYATRVVGVTGAATHLSSGFLGSCAIASGVSYCWGSNGRGQMANGGTAGSTSAVRSILPAGKKAVASTGESESRCWLFTDDSWGCAGRANDGQLGEGPTGRVAEQTTAIGVVITPSPLQCLGGSIWLGDGTCSFRPDSTYYYRVYYTLGSWRSPMSASVALRTGA